MKKTMRRIFGVLAFICFFLMLGFVGALENDMVTLGVGAIRMFLALGAWALFSYLAGAFEPYAYEKENRPENGTSQRR